jgi:regulator of cell morphogenesis and NO signaling
MNITPDTTVAEVVASSPGTIKVFQQHGVEFCCGGRRPLGEVCAERHIPYEQMRDELLRVQNPADTGEIDWGRLPLAELVRHIQDAYHEPLREELPRLEAMAERVFSKHGERFPEMLAPLLTTLRGLKTDLEAHMRKEEVLLFPYVVALEQAGNESRPPSVIHVATLAGPVSGLEEEHEAAGRALADLRRLTRNYEAPEGACPTFAGLFHGLEALEAAMHLHVHLENNILFPRAVALEQELGQGPHAVTH